MGAWEVLRAVDLGGVEAPPLHGLGLSQRVPRKLGTHDERGLAPVLHSHAMVGLVFKDFWDSCRSSVMVRAQHPGLWVEETTEI